MKLWEGEPRDAINCRPEVFRKYGSFPAKRLWPRGGCFAHVAGEANRFQTFIRPWALSREAKGEEFSAPVGFANNMKYVHFVRRAMPMFNRHMGMIGVALPLCRSSDQAGNTPESINSPALRRERGKPQHTLAPER